MKVITKHKKIVLPIIALLIPTLIFILFCFSRKIGIFGGNSFLVSDLQGQYIMLLTYLRNVNLSELFYSFSKGLGGGMIGTIAYYLASPFNLLIYLFPKNNILDAVNLLIGLKISLCGLTMYLYLRNHFKEDRFLFLIFSSCYALMSYIVNYHFHIMWLDGVLIFPLVMLGIDKLFDNKSLIYIISLFYALLSNYYIGYMICIASVLYFISMCVLKYKSISKKELKRFCLKFVISSLLAGLSTMFLLIPTALELKNGYKANSSVDFSGINLNFFDLWSRTYIGSNNYENVLAVNEISIYSGLIILPLVYFFFINKKISKREKVVYGSLTTILLSGFFIEAINTIFHAFNSTNCFNYRYSFITCFILIIIAIKSFINLKNIDIKYYLYFYIFYLVMSLFICIKDYSYLNLFVIYLSVFLMTLYMFLLYFYYRYNKNNDLKILLFIIVLAELLRNFFFSLSDFEYYKKEEFNYYLKDKKDEIYELQKDAKGYRIEKNTMFSYNDSLFMNYYGINSFLSTTDVNHLIFLKSAGYFAAGLSSSDSGNNSILMDSLLGVKYRISSYLKSNYKEIKETTYPQLTGILYHKDFLKPAMIYENPYALSMGYMISEPSTKIEVSNPFEFQNALLNSMLKTNTKYFKPYQGKKLSEGAYEFYIDNEELVYIYFYYEESRMNECDVLVNGKLADTASEIFTYAGNLNGEKIRVSLDGNVSKYGSAYAYYFDFDAFKSDIEVLKQHTLNISKIKGGYIKGEIEATSEMNTLFMSIPYEKGWSLYVDGKKTKIEVLYGAFIGAYLEEGTHTIELKYHVYGMNIGIIVSVISFILCVTYLEFEHINNKKLNNNA